MSIHTRPIALLQTLIGFDTTNPPGNERECIAYLDGVLQSYGIETTLLARDPRRPNLIARLKGDGSAPPLLLQGHVDVVPTAGQTWTHPPFAATRADGFIWGRGALDMKSGVVMMVCAFLRMHVSGKRPSGDIILCLMSDEEARSADGARFLVEAHPEQFEGVRFAIGEAGGFSQTIAGKLVYPIQVAEKLQCLLHVTTRGPGGHGSIPVADGAMGRMGRVLAALDTQRMPVYVTPVTAMMLEQVADITRPPTSLIMRQLLRPNRAERLLGALRGQLGLLEPLLRNTVSPTMIHAGHKNNVIPSEATLTLDGRMLPGFTPDEMVAELRAIVGDTAEIEVLSYDVPPLRPEPDMAQFEMLAGILRELDPEGVPIPLLNTGVTDGRFFARLGIQTYGFLPLKLPRDYSYVAGLHAADERVPATAVAFGTRAVTMALERYGRV